eukprot:4889325-Prymnesium_polylepis.1
MLAPAAAARRARRHRTSEPGRASGSRRTRCSPGRRGDWATRRPCKQPKRTRGGAQGAKEEAEGQRRTAVSRALLRLELGPSGAAENTN